MYEDENVPLPRLILDNGADASTVNQKGEPVLHIAAHTESAKHLRERDVAINAREPDELTALHEATSGLREHPVGQERTWQSTKSGYADR